MSEPALVLLDACVVVNLYATRYMPVILSVAARSVAVVDVVARESQRIRRGGEGGDRDEFDPVDLDSLIASGSLHVLTSNDESELLTFIDLARELDDGEAMTAAVAIHRGGVVVTDDKKASRILGERGVPLRSTLDICKSWAESGGVTADVVREALAAIRERGRYEPPRSHVLRAWWDSMLRQP